MLLFLVFSKNCKTLVSSIFIYTENDTGSHRNIIIHSQNPTFQTSIFSKTQTFIRISIFRSFVWPGWKPFLKLFPFFFMLSGINFTSDSIAHVLAIPHRLVPVPLVCAAKAQRSTRHRRRAVRSVAPAVVRGA